MKDHISVCICTYKRPSFIINLLEKLQLQETNNLFDISVVVVDNDINKSAEDSVLSYMKLSKHPIYYFNEPKQNISLARNMAIDNAKGNLIAIIDDDEFPNETWLINMYTAYMNRKVDGILGPVIPFFPNEPPKWLVDGKFCERKSNKTGMILHWDDTRTGNALFNGELFHDGDNRFNERFGRTGGEDTDFFERMIRKGRVFVWCEEAPVSEIVSGNRLNKDFYMKKYWRIGVLRGKYEKYCHRPYKYIIRKLVSLIVYILYLPISYFIGQHATMKCLTKILYNSGFMSGVFCLTGVNLREDDIQ